MKLLNYLFEKIAEYRPAKTVFPGIANRNDFERAWAYWHLGSAIARKKKYERAMAYFEKAILEYPYCWFFYWTLGGCYARLGQSSEAVNSFRIALVKLLRPALSRNSIIQKDDKNERKDKRFKVVLKPIEANFIRRLQFKDLPEATMLS